MNKAAPTHCLNCGDTAIKSFCASCGQRNVPSDMTNILGGFLRELVEEMLALRTVVRLIFRPGVLVAEYVDGKRRGQTNPLLMYTVAIGLYAVTNYAVPTYQEIATIPFISEQYWTFLLGVASVSLKFGPILVLVPLIALTRITLRAPLLKCSVFVVHYLTVDLMFGLLGLPFMLAQHAALDQGMPELNIVLALAYFAVWYLAKTGVIAWTILASRTAFQLTWLQAILVTTSILVVKSGVGYAMLGLVLGIAALLVVVLGQ